MRPADELREAVEAYLGTLSFAPELGDLDAALRYALEPGGKRVRPVLCLAVAEAAGGSVEAALPAAAALELVHTFSLVHDDLPSMDDDAVRRGRPSAHVAFGEGVALLAGDALLAEALRLALTYESNEVARDLVDATLGMIGGQYRDMTGDDADLAASIGSRRAGSSSPPCGWASTSRAFRRASAPSGSRSVTSWGSSSRSSTTSSTATATRPGSAPRAASRLADDVAGRARARLDELAVDTRVLRELVDLLAVRTA